MNQTQRKIYKIIKNSFEKKQSVPTPTQIGEKLGISRQQVTIYINRMLDQGLVEKQAWIKPTEKTLQEFLASR